MRVLVTGGAGYVGSVLVDDLRRAGHTIRVFDNLSHGMRCGSHLFGMGSLDLVFGDIRDRRAVAAALDGCDSVVHLAAVVGYPACAADPGAAQSVNVDGTRVVLESAGDRPVVVLSTLSTLGRVGADSCDEETVPQPASIYAATKFAAEHLAQQYGNAVVLRPATAFGLAPQMRFDLLIHQLTLDAMFKQRLSIYEPSAMRCFVHVRDLSSAIALAIESFESMRGRVFHVGNANLNTTKGSIARLLQDLTGCSISIDTAHTDGDARDYGGSFERLEREGFKAQHDLASGVREIMSGLALL